VLFVYTKRTGSGVPAWEIAGYGDLKTITSKIDQAAESIALSVTSSLTDIDY
jgi:hypothetical protein